MARPTRERAGDGGAAVAAAPPGQSSLRQTLTAWSFALPFLALFAVFMAGPILISLVVSFTDMRVTDIRDPFSINFVGLENYAALFEDGRFIKAAQNTAVFVVVGIPLTLVFGLAIAVGLNQAVVRAQDDTSYIAMGGGRPDDADHLVTEGPIIGFWKNYGELVGKELVD